MKAKKKNNFNLTVNWPRRKRKFQIARNDNLSCCLHFGQFHYIVKIKCDRHFFWHVPHVNYSTCTIWERTIRKKKTKETKTKYERDYLYFYRVDNSHIVWCTKHCKYSLYGFVLFFFFIYAYFGFVHLFLYFLHSTLWVLRLFREWPSARVCGVCSCVQIFAWKGYTIYG